MGKDKRGRECGKGILQRKDGKFSARFYDSLGNTYATRAIEQGMPPKVLQKLLGHANLSTTMDRYVHVTDESLSEAVKNFNSSMRAMENNS